MSIGGNFNPRPSYEGRRRDSWPWVNGLMISIHAPHTRGDYMSQASDYADAEFQSTPLIRGATSPTPLQTRPTGYFNPRPSYEGRLIEPSPDSAKGQFQSTPLIRGATGYHLILWAYNEISIHAPHTRGDASEKYHLAGSFEISIHAPHTRGDFHRCPQEPRELEFQSTPLIRGATALRILVDICDG